MENPGNSLVSDATPLWRYKTILMISQAAELQRAPAYIAYLDSLLRRASQTQPQYQQQQTYAYQQQPEYLSNPIYNSQFVPPRPQLLPSQGQFQPQLQSLLQPSQQAFAQQQQVVPPQQLLSFQQHDLITSLMTKAEQQPELLPTFLANALAESLRQQSEPLTNPTQYPPDGQTQQVGSLEIPSVML